MIKELFNAFLTILFFAPIVGLLLVFYSIHFNILKRMNFSPLALKRAFCIGLILSFLISAVLLGTLTYQALADKVAVVFSLTLVLAVILFYLLLAVYVVLDRLGEKKISLVFTFIAVACLFFAPFMAVRSARVAYFS